MRIDIVTLFPKLFDAFHYGVLDRAIKEGVISVHYWNPRKHANNDHGYIDDKPYGGGPGMVMCYEPLYKTIAEIKANSNGDDAKVICMSPQGKTFNDTLAKESTTLKQHPIYQGIRSIKN